MVTFEEMPGLGCIVRPQVKVKKESYRITVELLIFLSAFNGIFLKIIWLTPSFLSSGLNQEHNLENVE